MGERKYFEQPKIDFVIEDQYPMLDGGKMAEISEHWRRVSAGTNMFPGGVWCAHYMVEKGNEITLMVNRSDYAVYKFARDKKEKIVGAYTMGTGVLVYDEDREAFVFGRRSKDGVGFDGGMISVFGGVVDWDNTQEREVAVKEDEFLEMILEQAKKELGEELKAEFMGEPEPMGTYVDEDTLKVEFMFIVRARGVELSGDDENVELIYVKPEELTVFFEANKEQFEASTKGHMEHWVDKIIPIPE